MFFQILICRSLKPSPAGRAQTPPAATLVREFSSKTSPFGDHEVSTSLARLNLSEAKYVDRGGRPFVVLTSFVSLVSLQKNSYATRQNPRMNVSLIIMATSSSVTEPLAPRHRKARFACKRRYEGLSRVVLRWRRLFDKLQFILQALNLRRRGCLSFHSHKSIRPGRRRYMAGA